MKVEILLNVVSGISLQRKANWKSLCLSYFWKEKQSKDFIDFKGFAIKYLQVEFLLVLVLIHLEAYTYGCIYSIYILT